MKKLTKKQILIVNNEIRKAAFEDKLKCIINSELSSQDENSHSK